MQARTKLGLVVALAAVVAAVAPGVAKADNAFVCYNQWQVAPNLATEGSSPQLVPATPIAGVLFPPYPYTYAAGVTPAVAVLTSSLPAAFSANSLWGGVKVGNYTLLCNIKALFANAAFITGSYINDNGQPVVTPVISTILFGSVPIPGYHEVWRTS